MRSDRLYPLALGPHDFYLFVLHPAPPDGSANAGDCPEIRVAGRWPAVFERRTRRQLDDAAGRGSCRRGAGSRGKSRGIRRVVLVDAVRVPGPSRREAGYLCLMRVEYREGEPDTYVLPLVARSPVENGRAPGASTIAILETQEGRLALLDGADDPVLRGGAPADAAPRAAGRRAGRVARHHPYPRAAPDRSATARGSSRSRSGPSSRTARSPSASGPC